MAFQTVYWDANIFNALFGAEAGRVEACERIEQLAADGHVKIYTSAVTFVECIKIKNKQITNLLPEHEKRISEYFKREFITEIICDRKIGEAARSLIWKYPHLKPYDAIHVASAISQPIDVMHSYDNGDLVRLNGQIGNPPLKICYPGDGDGFETPVKPAELLRISN
jgi:predicted nucleic acid-binding protein